MLLLSAGPMAHRCGDVWGTAQSDKRVVRPFCWPDSRPRACSRTSFFGTSAATRKEAHGFLCKPDYQMIRNLHSNEAQISALLLFDAFW